mmetsp:Transcript_24482/g.36271  ORF Transcript_24482/g.36271 Transcript_24482/m.36271 type:complete len:90 (-) Transcript_24482:5-274(-)
MLMAAHFTYETYLNHCYQNIVVYYKQVTDIAIPLSDTNTQKERGGLLQTITDKAIPLSDTNAQKERGWTQAAHWTASSASAVNVAIHTV